MLLEYCTSSITTPVAVDSRRRNRNTSGWFVGVLLLGIVGVTSSLHAAPMLTVNKSNGDVFIHHDGGHYGFTITTSPLGAGLMCANYQSMAQKYGSSEFGGPWEPCAFMRQPNAPLAIAVVELTVGCWSGGSDYLGSILHPSFWQLDDPMGFAWSKPTGQPGLFEGVLGNVYYISSASVNNGSFNNGLLTHWQVDLEGNAQAGVIDWNADWVLQLISGSPAVVSQNIATPAAGMKLFFDFNFETPTGTLSVMLGDTILATLTAADDTQEGMTSYCLEVTDPALLGQESLALNFYFDGEPGSSVLLDNITFVEVPEPMTLGLLALGGLAFLKRRPLA